MCAMNNDKDNTWRRWECGSCRPVSWEIREKNVRNADILRENGPMGFRAFESGRVGSRPRLELSGACAGYARRVSEARSRGTRGALVFFWITSFFHERDM